MKLLLDTHAMLWFALNDPHLSGTALKLILDSDYEKLVSPASYWEIAIKISLNKYVLSQSYESFMPTAIDENGFGYMHIEPRHTATNGVFLPGLNRISLLDGELTKQACCV